MAKRRRRQDDKKIHKRDRQRIRERRARSGYKDDYDLEERDGFEPKYRRHHARSGRNKDLSVLIVAIIIVVAVVGGYFFYTNYFEDDPDKTSEPDKIIPQPNGDGGDGGGNGIYVVPDFTAANPSNQIMVMEIQDLGVIVIELANDKAPITAGNFYNLALQGRYNNCIFHRVIPDFMIQGGDFENNDGTGGHAAEYHTGYGTPSDPTSWVIPDEFHPLLKNDPGTLSMANSGPDTGGSQFFINVVNNNYLDNKHAVFGTVVAGMDLADEIAHTETQNDKPVKDVVIRNVYEYTGIV